MTAPSVPRCGRMDDHSPHVWRGLFYSYSCMGHVVTEGAQPCVACQRPVASCRCAEQRADEQNREWYS